MTPQDRHDYRRYAFLTIATMPLHPPLFGFINRGQSRGRFAVPYFMEAAAMPRKAAGLTAAKVRTAEPGRYGDGGGLYLLVRPEGGRFWLFRYVIDKKMREMGLGAASGRDAIMLTDARTAARKL